MKIEKCPFCGGKAILCSTGNHFTVEKFFVSCGVCGVETPRIARTLKEAVTAWNRRAQPENEPHTNDALTRDELYHLDGEPLHVIDGEGHECYCVVNTKNKDCIDNEAGAWCFEFYGMTGDGKHGLHKMGWLAYRTKPERSEG